MEYSEVCEIREKYLRKLNVPNLSHEKRNEMPAPGVYHWEAHIVYPPYSQNISAIRLSEVNLSDLLDGENFDPPLMYQPVRFYKDSLINCVSEEYQSSWPVSQEIYELEVQARDIAFNNLIKRLADLDFENLTTTEGGVVTMTRYHDTYLHQKSLESRVSELEAEIKKFKKQK